MESEEDMVTIWRLNTLVKLFDWRIALPETNRRRAAINSQKIGALAVNLSFAGMMCLIVHLLTSIAVVCFSAVLND